MFSALLGWSPARGSRALGHKNKSGLWHFSQVPTLRERRAPLVAVDAVVLRPDGSLVLVKRAKEPFRGFWALPGGFVRYGERVEDAVKREVMEETGLEVAIEGLVGVYSEPDRDPRGHVISIAFLAREVGGSLSAASDAAEVRAFRAPPDRLAFDHARIIEDAVEKFGLDIKLR